MIVNNQFMLFIVISCYYRIISCVSSRPNIILIVADDLGWNDVGFHGANELSTPNIDALAFSGVILNSHYSEAICTPSRAALLTAKYPIHTGTQHNVILEAAPWGLPLDQKLFPEYLDELGYSSHAFGKWHLGFFKKEYTPTYRGFKSHYGFWNGYQDYFSHVVQASFSPFEGMDMRRNLSVDWSSVGQYTTRLLTEEVREVIEKHNTSRPLFMYVAHLAVHAGNYEDPLQAPKSTVDKFGHIESAEKRIYAAMLWELDKSVGNMVSTLKAKGMLDNTIIVLLSDNGAATKGLHMNTGSNWPLKGEKATPWEGALRTVSLVWSRGLENKRRVSNHLMHISDWLPTLYSAAGGDIDNLGDIDGIDQWEVLNGSQEEKRQEILHNIDDIYGYSAIRIGKYKYVNGSALLGFLDDWVGKPEDPGSEYNMAAVLRSEVNSIIGELSVGEALRSRADAMLECPEAGSPGVKCLPFTRPCLFDIASDPCERNNIAERRPDLVEAFRRRIEQFRSGVREPENKRVDSKANPANFNNTWTNWEDYI